MHEDLANKDFVNGLCEQLSRLRGGMSRLGSDSARALKAFSVEYWQLKDEVAELRAWRDDLVRKCNEAGAPQGIPIWEAYRKAVSGRR